MEWLGFAPAVLPANDLGRSASWKQIADFASHINKLQEMGKAVCADWSRLKNLSKYRTDWSET